MRHKNVGTSVFRFVTKHVTDGQTDRQKGLSNTMHCYYMQSHGKKVLQLQRNISIRAVIAISYNRFVHVTHCLSILCVLCHSSVLRHSNAI